MNNLEFLRFQQDDDDENVNFRSDSTAGYDYDNDEPEFIDSNLEGDIAEAIEQISCKDWEEFAIEKKKVTYLQ